MSKWTHNICQHCWVINNPNRGFPTHMVAPDEERCCYCGEMNTDGIYTRDDPESLKCKGVHD